MRARARTAAGQTRRAGVQDIIFMHRGGFLRGHGHSGHGFGRGHRNILGLVWGEWVKQSRDTLIVFGLQCVFQTGPKN